MKQTSLNVKKSGGTNPKKINPLDIHFTIKNIQFIVNLTMIIKPSSENLKLFDINLLQHELLVHVLLFSTLDI